MAFSRIFKHALQNQFGGGFGGTPGGDGAMPEGGQTGDNQATGNEQKDATENCGGDQVGYVYSAKQKKCVPCTTDSQCGPGLKCTKNGANKGRCKAPPPASKNTKKPPQTSKIDYRAWFKQNNANTGLIDIKGLENEYPFKEWNYAIYHVNQDTLLPTGMGFPAGSSAFDPLFGGGEPYYWAPGELKNKDKAGHGFSEDAPILYADTVYYMVMRVYNTGEKSWPGGSANLQNVVGLTLTKQSSANYADKNMRAHCKKTFNTSNGAESICAKSGAELALQNKKPEDNKSTLKNKWFEIDLLDDKVEAFFGPTSKGVGAGQKIRSGLKGTTKKIWETKTAQLLLELEKNCSKGVSYTDSSLKKLHRELFRADNFWEFMYVITGYEGGCCRSNDACGQGFPEFLKCRYGGDNAHCSAAGYSYIDNYCALHNTIRSRWSPDPATTPYAALQIDQPGVWGKIWPSNYPPTKEVKLYQMLINGIGADSKGASPVKPRCVHSGFGKPAAPNVLPAGLKTPPTPMKLLKKGGGTLATYPKSPLITPHRCKLETDPIQGKEKQSQPDYFYNYGQSKFHCKDVLGIYSAHKQVLKTQTFTNKSGKKDFKFWKTMAPKSVSKTTDKDDVAYFGFYFKTPPKKEVVLGANDKGEPMPQLIEMMWDLVVPKTAYSKAPTPFKSWQVANFGKQDSEHVIEPIKFYVQKANYPGIGHFAKKITKNPTKASLKPPPSIQDLDADEKKKKKELLKTAQQTVDEDLKSNFWYLYNMDKFDTPPYNNGTYFIHNHFLGPVEDGFVAKGSLGMTTDKYRKYVNTIWQIARKPITKLDDKKGVTYGAYGSVKQSQVPPKMIFNYDYQIRKAVMPEVTPKETIKGATGGSISDAQKFALQKAKNQNLGAIRDRIYYWMRTTGIVNKNNYNITNFGYPQLIDTGFADQSIPYATDEDLEEIIKIEAISRKTMPHDIEDVNAAKDIAGKKIRVYCQHPYNVGTYSSAKKCASYSTVKPLLRQDYEPLGKKCSAENPCATPGYECKGGICKFNASLDSAKEFLNYDYKVQIRGIVPGYDLKDRVVMADGYQAPDWYYGKRGQEPDIKQGSMWAYRYVQPGPVAVNLQQGDFFDRAVWGHSSTDKDWQPTGKWIMPALGGSAYNPAKSTDIIDPRQKKLENSTLLNQRPTLQLSEPPVADVVREMIDSMQQEEWFYDYNFMYKPWVKNAGDILGFTQEMEVKTVLNYVGKCAALQNVDNLKETSLPFAYESNPTTSDPQADPQKKMDGRFIGITSKVESFRTANCIGTLKDTSIVSIHPDTMDLLFPKGENKLFDKENPIYNKITFDILNDRHDKVISTTNPSSKVGRKFLFNNLTEDERKEIFDYVISLEHNKVETPTVKALIAENLGDLQSGRPYFQEVKQIPFRKVSNLQDVQSGIIDLSVIPGKKGELKKQLSAVKGYLNDKLSHKAGPIGGTDEPNEWKFQNKRLKKEYFRDYKQLTRGALANYETVAYKVVKSPVATRIKEGDTYKQNAQQSFYIFPSFKFPETDLRRTVTFIDTQIKLGVEYRYDLYAVVLVYGTKYKYNQTQLHKEWKEVGTEISEAEGATLENYQKYPKERFKTPLVAGLAQSAQKVLVGRHPRGPEVSNLVGEAAVNTGQSFEDGEEGAEYEWYGLPGDTKESLPHKIRFVNSYSVSSYVDARPAMGIFEVPILRSAAQNKPAAKNTTENLSVAVKAEARHSQIQYGERTFQPSKPSGLSAAAINGPPLSPHVDVIPYSKINNKVLFMFQKMEGVEKVEATPEIKQIYGDIYKEQQNTIPRGTGTNQLLPDQMFFGNKEKKGVHVHGEQKKEQPRLLGALSSFVVHRVAGVRPNSLSDLGEPYAVVPVERASFVDDIEPNIKYYYAFRARGRGPQKNVLSFVRKIYSVELVDRAGTVIPYIQIEDLTNTKKQEETTIGFKKRLRIKPAFLQAMPNLSKGKSSLPGLGHEEEEVWQPTPAKKRVPTGTTPKTMVVDEVKAKGDDMPRWKFRITSKSTQRKIDVNVFFRKSEGVYQPLDDFERSVKFAQSVGKGNTIYGEVDWEELEKLRKINLREDIIAGIYKKILAYDE